MISFKNVTKIYDTKSPALDSVSLQIDRGEFVFLVGASGSGKSSCLKLIQCAAQPSSGDVHVLGHNLRKISHRKIPFFRRNLGVVFQDFLLLPDKTVYENVAFSLQVIGKSRGYIQEAVPRVLEQVGLGGKERRYPQELSGGEQQRVTIARAIVNKPAILLADEPTGNLDPATSLGIMKLLQAINAGGTTVVMATHEAGFVDVMKQRVIELSNGKIVRDEKGGGYGHTAAIKLDNLFGAASRSSDSGLLTTQTIRRELAPETAPVAVAAAAPAMPVVFGQSLGEPATGTQANTPGHESPAADTVKTFDPGLGLIETPQQQETPELPEQQLAAPAEPELGESEQPAVPSTVSAGDPQKDLQLPAAPAAQQHTEHSVFSNPATAQASKNSIFMRPAAAENDELDETLDPVHWAQKSARGEGGLADRLGITSDDETNDVGPVR